jgi:hypothetical protein
MEIKIKYSAMLPEATQARGLVQNKRDDDGTVVVVLYYSEEGDDTNLDCSDDDTNLAVACDDIPFRKCHHGDNEIPDNVWHDKTDDCKKSSAYAGNHDDPCRQVITSTGQDDSLASSLKRMINAAWIAHCEKGMNGSEGNRGPEQGEQEVDNDKKPRRKYHRASLYIARHNDGTSYHLRMTPELREEYRKLTTRDEKRAFIVANGLPGVSLSEYKARILAKREKKRFAKESTGEIPEVN